VFNSKCDIYSLALTMYDCYFPNLKRPSVQQVLQHAQTHSFPTSAKVDLIDLLKKMLTIDPTERLTATDALSHSYFTSGTVADKEALEKTALELQRSKQQLDELFGNLQNETQRVQQDQKKLEEQQKKMLENKRLSDSQLDQQTKDLQAKELRLLRQTQDARKEQERLKEKEKEIQKKMTLFLPPLYWTNTKTNFSAQRIDITPTSKNNIQELLNSTCFPQFIGIGKDSHGLKHKGFQVVKVERIENFMLWKNYTHRRDMIALQNAQVPPVNSKVQSVDPSWMNDLELFANVNEVFLFHGTSAKSIEHIAHQGLDDRIAKDGMLGSGIYFSENSSKSDEYITPDAHHNCSVFLCRVLLGIPFVTMRNLEKIRRPPCRNGDFGICGHSRADSVLAECKRTSNNAGCLLERYREFVVYDRSHCYPEFLITFKRVKQEAPNPL